MHFLVPALYFCFVYLSVGACGPDSVRFPLALGALGSAAWISLLLTFFAPTLLPSLRVGIPLALLVTLGLSQRARVLNQDDIVILTLVLLPTLLLAGVVFSSAAASPLTFAQNVWSHPLPPDNVIPLLFGEGLRAGDVPSPLLGDWLSSDRPPLLSGIYLFGAASLSEWGYQGVAQASQLMVVPTSYWLARRVGGPVLTSIAAASIVGTSPLVLVNSIYVWPKLLAAAFVLTSIGLVLSERSRLEKSLFALLMSFAILSHGGVLFSILGVLLWIIVNRAREAVQLVPYAALSALVLVPWVGYQRLVDPPGNRLLRWHLAATMDPGSETLSAILALYRNLGLSGFASGVEQKAQSIIVHPLAAIVHWSDVDSFRVAAFFHPIPAMGVGALVIAVALATRSADQQVRDIQALTLYGIGLFLILAQSASGPGFVVHESSYVFWTGPVIAACVQLSRHWVLGVALLVSVALLINFFLLPTVWPSLVV